MPRFWMIVAFLFAAPVSARDLAVPADKGWQHAGTGLVVMPDVAGFRRTGLSDNTESEHDVVVQFGEDADGSFATLYLFHPAAGDAAMWFDRAQDALDRGRTGKNSSPATAEPLLFAVAGAPVPTAFRQAYSIAGGNLRSTAVALVPIGDDWVVKLRMSSRTLSADRLDARLMQMIGALRWPKAAPDARPAALIQPCAAPLSFGKAKRVKPDGADILISLMAGSLAAEPTEAKADAAPPATWCREGEARADFSVYRADAARDGYVIAMNDAGRAIHVSPSLMAQIGGGKARYSVTMSDVDGARSAYPAFTALPRPEQAWETVMGGTPAAAAKGDTVTIGPAGLYG